MLNISLVDGPLLGGIYLAALGFTAILLVVACWPVSANRTEVRGWAGTHPLSRIARVLLVIVLGLGAGFALVWFLGDQLDLFDLQFTYSTRLWVACAVAVLALGGLSFVHSRRWVKVVACISVLTSILAAAGGINAEFGQYTTVRSALGISSYEKLDVAREAFPTSETGTVGTVIIPATVSGFAARRAVVYLPAAARSSHPPKLPVIVMLSGQPGSPQVPFTAGRLLSILDPYAVKHHGIAPIVVIPDQLGSPNNNPMCVDSSLGNSATYLTVDVPNWIKSQFSVASSPSAWTIAGFSQGGTCSIQLAAAHPTIFGNALVVSGELAPHIGSVANTIKRGFGGSAAAHAASAPKAIMTANAPYKSLMVFFAAGSNDPRYLATARELAAVAKESGIRTRLIVSPGTGHDWHTVHYAWAAAFATILARGGLPTP
ncbi:MAG: hypothetical protein H7248_10560 [Microbacteriaceae bacterium]|nr:hypothetical protein [Microbacteriaceae bacterium]